jgi:hypothetical protein
MLTSVSMIFPWNLPAISTRRGGLLEDKDADVERFIAEANSQRAAFAKKRDEIYAVAT